MRIALVTVGKTDDPNLTRLLNKYISRLEHYTKFELTELPDIKNTKNLSEMQQKEKEAMLLLKKLSPSDYVILFDESGDQYSSRQFSGFLQKRMNSGIKRLVFMVGGPYGFGKSVLDRANQKISLSKMTFSHQMVRLFIAEQFYRAFSILRNEPYHHE